jgi:hypothetical protein
LPLWLPFMKSKWLILVCLKAKSQFFFLYIHISSVYFIDYNKWPKELGTNTRDSWQAHYSISEPRIVQTNLRGAFGILISLRKEFLGLVS